MLEFLAAILKHGTELVQIASTPAALYLGWQGVSAFKLNGDRQSYARSVLKAAGAGHLEASAQGLSLFSPEGRAVAIKAGAEYLLKNAAPVGAALGIKDFAAHAERVASTIGLLDAHASAITAAAPVAAPASALAARLVETMLGPDSPPRA